jgi:hypothetical protein
MYAVLRNEILLHQFLLYTTTLVVALVCMAAVVVCERRDSVLSVLAPALASAWAGAVLRFDYLIHRQGAYLLILEDRISAISYPMPLWEHWKGDLPGKALFLGPTDALTCLAVVAPALYLTWTLGRRHLQARAPQWALPVAVCLTALIMVPLLLLPFVPAAAVKQ